MFFKFLIVPVGIALCAVSLGVRGDIIVTLPSTTTTPEGPGFQAFSYDANLTAGEKLLTGNFFTIYDVAGFSTATGPAGWTMTSSLVGTTPTLSNPPDNVLVPNVTFTYTGAPTAGGPTDLGFFLVTTDSLHAALAQGYFASEATKDIAANTLIDNAGQVRVPIAGVAATPTPLPPALYAAVPALLLAWGVARRQAVRA